MKKTITPFSTLFLGVLLFSCTTVSRENLANLNGYWEIEEVRSHGETFTPKGGAVLVDFYEWNGTMGFRKKLAPSFSNTYNSSEDRSNFSITKHDGDFYIDYSDALEPWKEKILSISGTHLELNHSDKTYRYKRHNKLSL